jgi:hypothetical protein
MTYLPTKFSSTDDFPADCPPTTAIWGRSITMGAPSWVKASCMRLMTGIRFSMPALPWFPDMAAVADTVTAGKTESEVRRPLTRSTLWSRHSL